MNLERILWDDAGSFTSEDKETAWQSVEDIVEDYTNANFTISSVGYVVHEDNDSVILASNFSNQYTLFSQCLRIPKGMIKARAVIKPTNIEGTE